MISWRTALKFIPWQNVLQAAPSVLNGAKQLWQGTRPHVNVSAPIADIPDITTDPVGNLKARVLQLEKTSYDTSMQTAQAADVVKALAEQQQQLVSEITKLRIRFRVLVMIAVVLIVSVLKLLIWG